MIDKQKHGKEFRLRILLTNQCDKQCETCLNDFQTKGTAFIEQIFVKRYVDAYINLCLSKKIRPTISLSGGEPGLHPQFYSILQITKQSGAKVQVNTNGLIDKYANNWGRSVDVRYHMGHDLRNTIIPGQTAVIIIHPRYSTQESIDFIRPFYEGGMRIKTFAEYYSSDHFRQTVYPEILTELNNHFPISGRHTGVQENRGKGCDGCKKECVTLKALWLFPNNTSSFCPQRLGIVGNPDQIMLDAYQKHLIHRED